MRRVLPLVALMPLLIASARAGSVWPAHATSLVSDTKAYRVGDIVTIEVQEESSVSSEAGSKNSKTSASDAKIEAAVMPTGMYGTKTLLNAEQPKIKMDSTRSFDGSGSFTLSDKVETSISATVREVLPNGALLIEGKRVRQSVDDTVEIFISGIARPEDISTNNVVSSASLAEANIIVRSRGPVHRAGRRGWFDRAVDFIWPF